MSKRRHPRIGADKPCFDLYVPEAWKTPTETSADDASTGAERRADSETTSASRQLLDYWKDQVIAYQQTAYATAQQLHNKHYVLGATATLLVATTGTALFATLSKDPGPRVRLLVAIVSLVSALFTALQTFLDYGRRSEMYRTVSTRCASVVRAIRILKIYWPESVDKQMRALRRISASMGGISKQAPILRFKSSDVSDAEPAPAKQSPPAKQPHVGVEVPPEIGVDASGFVPPDIGAPPDIGGIVPPDVGISADKTARKGVIGLKGLTGGLVPPSSRGPVTRL